MNKKTLYLILVVPFVIALLGFTNVLIIKNFVEVDITDIKRKYNDTEGFKIRNDGYLLEAEGVVPEGLKVSEGNELVWTSNDINNEFTRLEEKDGQYYLTALHEGEVTLTCSNAKKTKSKSFKAVIYKNGAIIINPQPKGSGYSIGNVRNFGEFDLGEKDNKNLATYNFDVKVLSDDESTQYKIVDYSKELIDISLNPFTIKVKPNTAGGEAFVNLESVNHDYIKGSYKFKIIDNGVNVYSYEDLLSCTNKSQDGEIVCLQTSLESKENTFDSNGSYKDTNVRLFGNEKKMNFKDEVYTFETTYNHKFITQVFGKQNSHDDVITGIHVQKDFYGNGFVINGKELAYPNNGKINQFNGKLEPGEGDLFKGPLTFFSIGVFDMPVVKAFGQDNSLMYVDGDNITIDDLIIQSTDKFNNSQGEDTSSNNMYNLEYTGTVIDVHGKNVTIKNSEIKNGRTGLRVFSSPNFMLDNSLISTAREFLMKVGCNETLTTDYNKQVKFEFANEKFIGKLSDFLTNKDGYNADRLIESMLFKNQGSENARLEILNRLQTNLDAVFEDEISYGQNITVKDSYFSNSGIFSIAFDTYFNGCFLYDGTPDVISQNLKEILRQDFTIPDNVGATMLPTKLDLVGDVRFYDWKEVNSIDASCLIEERLAEFINSTGFIEGLDIDIPIDTYFPIKKLLNENSNKMGLLYKDKTKEKEFLNTKIAFYGGGKNMSTFTIDKLNTVDLSDKIGIDILKNSMQMPVNMSGKVEELVQALLSRCVPVAAGFNEFKLYCNDSIEGENTPYLYNKSPSKQDFIERYEENVL